MMKNASTELLLRSLYLTTMAKQYEELAVRAEKDEWGYIKYLHNLSEIELSERRRRRIQRWLKQSNLPEDKAIETLDLKQLPSKVQQQIPRLLAGDFVKRAVNVLAFGLPGRGKTHLLSAIGRELIIQKDYRVLSIKTFQLVQRLLEAKRDLKLENVLRKLDSFDVVLLDDIGYVQQDREEMEVLFTFLAERYERKSMMITSNLVFSEWDKIFKDPMTTAAAIDRLVHHSIILELDNESFRAKESRKRQKGGEKN